MGGVGKDWTYSCWDIISVEMCTWFWNDSRKATDYGHGHSSLYIRTTSDKRESARE